MTIKEQLLIHIGSFAASALVVWCILAFMTSCVNDNLEDCSLDLKFRYLYNMQNADGFANEAGVVDLYVFDSEKRFVSRYTADVSGKEDFTMHLPLPTPGKYTFVAWAHGTELDNEMSNFDIPEIKVGESPELLTARIRRIGNTAKYKQNSLLNGTLEAEVSGENRHLCIDMMKCNNDIRVILMPIRAGQTLVSEDYDIRIEGNNGWLAFNAAPYRRDELTYAPHNQVRIANQTNPDTENEEIDNAILADLSTSRIMAGSNPRLIVHNKRFGRDILNIDLAWFLSLQAIGEHKAEWSNQEYLDRQDKYSMTFFIDDTTWLTTHIIVNGWVLSLEDIGLK